MPSPSYLADKQVKMTEYMRRVVVNWIVDVVLDLELLNEVLFLAVNCFDRFLSLSSAINKDNLQLVAITCVLLAAYVVYMV